MIAYFILVHRYPNQFKRLFRAIYSSENYYLVHVDKRAGTVLLAEITDFLVDFPNSHILKSQSVVWGGYSMVEAELRGIKELLRINSKWDFFINLSGQDFPLKSQPFIKNFLKQNKGKSFMLVLDQKIERPNTLNRINNYFVESKEGFVGTPFRRAFLPNVVPYIGGQWKILTRGSCEFICSDRKVAKFIKFDETVDFKIFDALENSFKRRTKPRTRVSTSAVTFGDVSLPVAQFLGRPN